MARAFPARAVIHSSSLAARIIRAVLFGSLALGLLVACKRTPAPAGPLAGVARTPAPTPADQTYTTRGRLESLPTPDGKQPLVVHHQTIADFLDEDGSVVGMTEHAMAFPWLSDSLDLGEARPARGVFPGTTHDARAEARPRFVAPRLEHAPDMQPDRQGGPSALAIVIEESPRSRSGCMPRTRAR
ncbi:MAG: hypothetical protein IPM33_04755 [Phycisphaerales bacterium]|nr:hypothetical protein [Phycisphaerales bacterium]